MCVSAGWQHRRDDLWWGLSCFVQMSGRSCSTISSTWNWSTVQTKDLRHHPGIFLNYWPSILSGVVPWMGYVKETAECETLAMDLQPQHVTLHITTLGWGRPCHVFCLNVDPPSSDWRPVLRSSLVSSSLSSGCLEVLNHCGTAQRGHSLQGGVLVVYWWMMHVKITSTWMEGSKGPQQNLEETKCTLIIG